MMWEEVPSKTSEDWLSLRDPQGWWTASVRWGGCISLTRYYNSPEQEQGGEEEGESLDRIHICDLDDYILRLIHIRYRCLAHFGSDWEGVKKNDPLHLFDLKGVTTGRYDASKPNLTALPKEETR